MQYLHKKTNFLVFGALDDLWQNSKKEYIVVDYKATGGEKITELNKDYHANYKRQMEIYQWLLRRNNYQVSSTGYFVYCSGKKDKKAFDGKLEFDVVLIPYTGNDSWVEKTILDIYQCLNQKMPEANSSCTYCRYLQSAKNLR